MLGLVWVLKSQQGQTIGPAVLEPPVGLEIGKATLKPATSDSSLD